jgi:electron transfer flavoprotein beta subunit
MKILVLMKMVPDIVEELEVAGDGTSLDQEYLRFIVNERDDYALEQALLLKDRLEANVTVVAPEAPEVDDVLYAALAKGADRVVKVSGAADGAGSRSLAATLAATLPSIPDVLPADMVLSGCQAIDDLDGFTAPLLASALDLPYLGLVSRIAVAPGAGVAVASKEYAGGVMGRFEIALPAFIGVQGCEKPPRYVPIAKIRAAMASGGIEDATAVSATVADAVRVTAMAKPTVTGHAEMLEGSVPEVAEKVADLLADRGLL